MLRSFMGFASGALVLVACGNAPRTPTEVPGVADVISIAIGDGQTCALVEGGEVRCLGTNENGELGNGEKDPRKTSTSQRVLDGDGAPLRDVSKIAAFKSTSCARRGTDSWHCWGEDPLGVLELTEATHASEVAFLRGATSMTVGSGERLLAYYPPGKTVRPSDALSFAYVCGTFPDRVSCRTARRTQIARDTTFDSFDIFAGRASAVASGTGAICLLTDAGEVRCNSIATEEVDLAGATPTESCDDKVCEETPEETRSRVLDVTKTISIASIGGAPASSLDVGDQHACMLRDSGNVDCLGLTYSGEAGARAEGSERTSRAEVRGVSSIVELALGNAFSCARSDGGEVRCWGNNSAGQLGSERAGIVSETPVVVTLTGAASAIAAGRQHACAAVGSSRQLVCWGSTYTTPF